jgi:bacterioferritin-associated ferredoxin
MKADDELCLCFHVTRRKVEQFIRARRPSVPSQLSECYGAGTGCGWCRPFLQRLHAEQLGDDLPDAAEYASQRAAYRAQQKQQRLSEPYSGAGEG